MSYVVPHFQQSRAVTQDDFERVFQDGNEMFEMCSKANGIHHAGAFAIAHPQICDDDPLRFFVTREGELIINPEIIRHTKVPVKRVEGCMSFPFRRPIATKRYNKIEVRYWTFDEQYLEKTGKLKLEDEPRQENLNGRRAHIFQHELDHFEPKWIYGDEVVKEVRAVKERIEKEKAEKAKNNPSSQNTEPQKKDS